MALFIDWDQTNYGVDGAIRLYTGDDWHLTGRIVDLIGGVKNRVDLSALQGASAFFPAASGGMMTGLMTVVDSVAGLVKLSVAASQTPYANISDVPCAPYAVVQSSGLLQTVPPLDTAVVIADRGSVLSP